MLILTWKQHWIQLYISKYCTSEKGWIQIRFVADNSGEVTPFDWYNAWVSISFKVNKTADSGNIAANDHSGIVNGSYSFLKNFDVKLNSKRVYDFSEANHAVKIKNLLQYSPVYAESTATNEFFYLNTNRNNNRNNRRTGCKNQLKPTELQ